MIPNGTKVKLLTGAIDLSSDTLRVLLLKDTTSYTPDPDSHATVQDVLAVADEYDDTNYSRKDLANVAVTQDDSDDEAVFDADDITWATLGSSSGQTIEAVVVYRQVGGDDSTPGDDEVIRVMDDSEEDSLPQGTNGSDITVQFDSEGVVNLA